MKSRARNRTSSFLGAFSSCLLLPQGVLFALTSRARMRTCRLFGISYGLLLAPGLFWATPGLSWAILGLSWVLLGLSWGPLGFVWTTLCPLPGPLGRSWALLDHPCALLGISGLLWAPDWPDWSQHWARLVQETNIGPDCLSGAADWPRLVLEFQELQIGPHWSQELQIGQIGPRKVELACFSIPL